MKMPSSHLPRAAAVFAAAALIALSTTSRASTPGEVFTENREVILATNSVSMGDFVFFVGRAVSEDRLGAAVGFGKARALAWGQLDRHLFAASEWPADATPEERRAIWLQVGKRSDETISGAETVFETHPGPGRWLVVLAVPSTEVARLRPSSETLKKAMDDLRTARERENGETESLIPPNTASATEPGAEPRGLWEENGVKANETMSENQF